MSYENQTISMHYVRSVIEALGRRGIAQANILAKTGISPEMLTTPGIRITPLQLSVVMQNAWEQADDEFIGMTRTASRHGVFTMMAQQIIHSPDLGSVYRHLARFYNLTTDAFILEICTDQDTAQFSMKLKEPELDVQHMMIDFFMLVWHRFPAWLSGQRIPLLSVEFDFTPPPHAAEYRLLFPCPAHFETGHCRFTFPAECLSWPVVQTRDSLKAHLRRAPLDWFQKQNYYPNHTRRILDAMMAGNRFRNLSIEEVAEQLAMTSRTLRRKLVEEGTTFREIKHIARRDTAIHLLSQRKLPVGSIAQILGFTEAASFSRAFKEWTGVNPHFYKK